MPHSTVAIKVVTTFPDRSTESAWREFLNNADFPSHYTAPEFFLEPRFRGNNPFAVLAYRGGSIVGVLTGTVTGKDVLSGQESSPQIALLPGQDAGPVLARLIEGALGRGPRAGRTEICSWREMEAFAAAGFRCQELNGVVMIDLSQGPTALFRGFSQRSNITKAMRSGLEVAQASSAEEFGAYWEIYARWSADRGFAVVPQVEFCELFARVDNRRLFLARYEGKIIAGSVVRFNRHGLLEYAANSSLPQFQQLRANDLLQWRIIEWGAAEGLRWYSMGGTSFFHQKFGGATRATFRYCLDRSFLRRHDRKEQVLTLARRIWKSVPAGVKRRLLDLRANCSGASAK